MAKQLKDIEIPFGAKDSELKGWEYTIPEGMEAEIKDGKIIVKEKESKDDRIRKELIRAFKSLNTIKVWNGIERTEILAWLEKQGEQKLADKVEPKFKVGDWVVNNNGEPQLSKVISRSWPGPWPDSKIKRAKDNLELFINTATLDKQYHLWTIQDAKDGDVLFQDLMEGKTFIYNGVSPDMAILYSFIISNDGKDVLPYHIGKPNTGIGNIEENKNIIHPATKEQRDLLFKKMHEAGYEWDAEKKELKKIEKKNIEGTFINVDEVRENFVKEVYRVLANDTTNDRANDIIYYFDSLPTIYLHTNKSLPSDGDDFDMDYICELTPPE